MGIGKKRTKKETKNEITIDLDGNSFKSVNTTIQTSDLAIVPKRSLLKRLGSIPGTGVLLAALSSVCFSTGSLCTRLLGDERVNSNQVVVARSILQLVVYLVVSYWKSTPLFGVKGERWALFLRASFGFVSLAGNYMAIQMIGLSDASSIVFSAPVFVTFIAFFLLREPLRCTNLLTLVMVILGIILICKPEILIEHNKVEVIEEEARLIGSVIALVACLANAMTYITLRKLKKTSSQISIIWFSIVSIIFGVALNAALFDFNLPLTPLGWGLMLLNGLCGVFGQLLLTLSLKITEAGPVSMARTMDIVMSFVYQVTILNQAIEIHTIIGAVLIVVGVIITSVGMPLLNKIKSDCCKRSAGEEESNANNSSNQNATAQPQ